MAEAGHIAWVGGLYFTDEHATRHGFTLTHIPLTTPAALTWDDIVARCDGEPDYVVYTDRSFPPPLLGIESFPCPTAFYAIDSHIHSWMPMYAQGFDLAAVSLRDHLPRFRQHLDDHHVIWMPPYPLRDEYPPTTPPVQEWDMLFVGNVDPETTPERYAFLKELKVRFPGLEIRQGVFGELFPRARLVLNIAERGDLNFRVFEALATGACLVTPEIGHGQDLLFTNGKHLITYPAHDVEQLVSTVCELLDNPEKIQAIAAAGHAELNARHRAHHRADTLFEALKQLGDTEVEARRQRVKVLQAKYMKLVYLHWAEAYGDNEMGRKYLQAARG